MKNLFKTKFDAAVIVLIPACIGINYLCIDKLRYWSGSWNHGPPWIYEIIPEGNSYSLCSRSCRGCDLHPVKRIILGRYYWKCMG